MKRLMSKAEPWLYQAMRVVVGLLFAFHGAQKLFGMFGGRRAALVSQFGLAGIVEFFGGLLVAIGVAVSPVAFISSGQMAVAYLQAHAPRAPWPIQNGGEPAVLFCFVMLYIAARGRK